MKAIETKYHGPSNIKGSRVSASDMDNNRIVLSYDHAMNADENHRKAAYALRDKMGWTGDLVGGGTKTGYCWVFVGDR